MYVGAGGQADKNPRIVWETGGRAHAWFEGIICSISGLAAFRCRFAHVYFTFTLRPHVPMYLLFLSLVTRANQGPSGEAVVAHVPVVQPGKARYAQHR